MASTTAGPSTRLTTRLEDIPVYKKPAVTWQGVRKLIGIIAHPLNRPRLDPVLRRVTAGYGILQPRVSVNMSSAAGSAFARTYAGHTGVDPYTTAVSDVYQDLFDEGIFTGKGLYDVDAFRAALSGRVPENAVLSHDLFEGLYARTALVSDIEVVDDYPSTVLAHARRQHRWVRGDWQILWWLFPFVPSREGVRRNRLPLISRWKILDNLRRSLMAPATVALLLAGWTILPGSPIGWTAVGLLALAFPVANQTIATFGTLSRRARWRAAFDDLQMAAARSALQATFLASQAYEVLHAIEHLHQDVIELHVAVDHRPARPRRAELVECSRDSGACEEPLACGRDDRLFNFLFQGSTPDVGVVAPAERSACRASSASKRRWR
jgi:cyclic beta-1,2-glucan synthetase